MADWRIEILNTAFELIKEMSKEISKDEDSKNDEFSAQLDKICADISIAKYIICDDKKEKSENMFELIKRLCEHEGISATKLGKSLGLSQAGFRNRCIIGKFSQTELQTIAKSVDGKYFGHFIWEDGTVI